MASSIIPTCAIVMSMVLSCCYAVTEDDIKECGTSIFSSVTCTSASLFYTECPVPGATEVNKIKLSKNLSEEICEFEVTFGFRKNAVWITNGCSGEFYVCYNGVRVTTTVDPRSTSPAVVPRESVDASMSDNVTLYIVIAAIVAILVLFGLILGCLVKRRQSAEKSRQLADKRCMNLEARESKVDEDVRITPIIRKQPSLESVCFPETTIDLDKYEKGSVCSSRSSTSGLGSYISRSSRTAGKYVTSGRPASGGLSLVLDPRDLKRAGSVPDIKSSSELGLRSNSAFKGSQTSLVSIKEMTSRNSSELQGGGRRKRYSQRPLKYNTVGFRGNCADNLYSPSRAGMTLPAKRSQTRAYVHAERGSHDSGLSRMTNIEADISVSFGSHYEDPQELILRNNSNHRENVSSNDSAIESDTEFRPISPATSNSEELYSTVIKKSKKPIIPPKPKKDMSITEKKYNINIPPVLGTQAPPLYHSTSLEEINHDEIDVSANDVNEKPAGALTKPKPLHYAFMQTFKPSRDYEDVDLTI